MAITRSTLRRYGGAILAVALATAVRLAVDSVRSGRYPLGTFFLAIVFAAWYGGQGPALLALALSLVAIPWSSPGARGSIFHWVVETRIDSWRYLLGGLAIALLGGSMRAARRRAEEALTAEREHRERLQVTLQSIADGIIATDAGGTVTGINPVAERLTGWTSDEAAGRPLKDVFRTVDPATHRTDEMPVAQVIRVGAPRPIGQTELVPRGGPPLAIEHRTAPIRDDRGEITGAVIVFRDVTERRQAEEALRQSEDRFSRFMQQLPGLAWIKDTDGRYVYVNDSAESAFRVPRADLYGKTDAEVFAPEVAAQFRENDRRALASAAGVQVIETLEHDDGVLHHSIVSKFPIPGPDGRVALLGGIAIDITDRMRMERALRDADRRKDEFLATLAHELRNPLAPIRNALHLMGQPDREGEGFEAERAMAERQVTHLARLVDDLMDVSRISRGKIELRKEAVDLATAVRRAVESARSALDERGHALVVAIPDEPIRVEADPTRLEQVVWNLLNNAAKYTEPGGEVRLTVERQGGEVAVRVRDTGLGIEPEMLPRIFEMFVQAGHRSDRTQGGLGIGLSLVKTLVEMHGGRITARSQGPGTGSEFEVRLPVLAGASTSPAGPGPAARSPSPEPLPRRRVLVVDDNVDAATSLGRLLTRLYGQDVRVAHDGPSALEAADEFRPELVLLDIGMPGMDGYEVARRLRGRPDAGGTLLVALTGWGQESDRQRSREAGFDHHLVKPVEPDQLRRLLEEAATGPRTPRRPGG